MIKTKSFKILSLVSFGLALGAETVMASENWDVSLWGSRRGFTEHVEKLAEVVKEKSNGAFHIKLHYGGVLSKSRENLDGISFGAFEMAQTCAFYHPDKTPGLSVTSLPALIDTGDLRKVGAMSQRVYQHSDIKKEFANWNAKILMPTPLPFYNLVGKGKAPVNLGDYKGMRVRIGGPMANVVRGLGGDVVLFPASETYTALDTGAAQAVAFAPHAHLAFKTVELGSWRTKNLNLGTVDCPVVVNQDAYNGLSDKNKQILESAVHDALEHYYNTYASYTNRFLDASKNMQVVMYSDTQKAHINKLIPPIWDKWLSDMKKKGIDGAGLLKAAQNK